MSFPADAVLSTREGNRTLSSLAGTEVEVILEDRTPALVSVVEGDPRTFLTLKCRTTPTNGNFHTSQITLSPTQKMVVHEDGERKHAVPLLGNKPERAYHRLQYDGVMYGLGYMYGGGDLVVHHRLLRRHYGKTLGCELLVPTPDHPFPLPVVGLQTSLGSLDDYNKALDHLLPGGALSDLFKEANSPNLSFIHRVSFLVGFFEARLSVNKKTERLSVRCTDEETSRCLVYRLWDAFGIHAFHSEHPHPHKKDIAFWVCNISQIMALDRFCRHFTLPRDNVRKQITERLNRSSKPFVEIERLPDEAPAYHLCTPKPIEVIVDGFLVVTEKKPCKKER